MSSAAITAAMSVGGAFALWLTGWLLDQAVNWRTIFAYYALVGIIWSAAFYFFFRTLPSQHPGVNAAELALLSERGPSLPRASTVFKPAASGTPESEAPASAVSLDDKSEPQTAGVLESEVEAVSETRSADQTRPGTRRSLVAELLASPSMWGLCIQAFFRAAGYSFFVTWFFAFLEYAYDISKAEAGFLNSLPLIAVVVGSLFGGIVVDAILQATNSKWLSRTGTAFVSLAACGTLTLASVWSRSPTDLSILIACGALFSGIGSPAAWAATIDVGARNTAVVMGTMNMAGCLAGVVLPVVLGGWIREIRTGNGNWDHIIYLHAAFYFLGALSWLLVNPRQSLSKGESPGAV